MHNSGVKNGHSNENIAEKTSLFFFFFLQKAKSAMNWCFVAVFFLFVLGSPVRKTSGRDSRDCLVKNQGVLWSIWIFDHSSFHTFPGISQNLLENVSIFFCWNDTYVHWLRKTEHFRRYLDEILHCSKSMGWDRPISVEANSCARARRLRSAARSINSGRHILERCANDALLTSFRATLIGIWVDRQGTLILQIFVR